MYRLNDELQKCLRIIDPYMPLRELMDIFDVCMNVMIRLRRDINLGDKPKGRPKNSDYIFEQPQYPQEVLDAVERVKEIRAKEKAILEEYRQKQKEKRTKRKSSC